MNESVVKTKYGECRCCLTLGKHRDLLQEYEWNGTREVYFDIFLECFNVMISTNTDKSNLICTSCVSRLRDANSFKKMVLEAERNLNSFDIKQDDSESEAVDPDPDISSMLLVQMKKEPEEASDTEHDVRVYYDNYIPEPVKAGTANKRPKRPAPSRQVRDENRKDKLAFIHNATIILNNSNVTPFKPKYQNGFPCFYCTERIPDLPAMREHQKEHTETELETVLHAQGAEAFIVYVDITDLKCTICNEEIPNLTKLKSHLITEHEMKMEDCPDRIIPFKITQNFFECQVCSGNYETFGAMERHMNIHFRNYICKECGTGFATTSRLKVHVKQQHNKGTFQCETCKKVYNTPLKLKHHVNGVHNLVKRLKCVKCDERFVNYFKQKKHMAEVHGETKPEFKCNNCDKIFDRKYLLSAHIKRDHLEQRDFKCEKCPYTCFGRSELNYHMISHTGERVFKCSECDKSFARKKSLREHMRGHNNDRRYTCKVCGQAFIQNCSLKRHIKKHHSKVQV